MNYYGPLDYAVTLFEGKNVCKTQENCVSAGGVAIANHSTIVDLVDLLRRRILVRQGAREGGRTLERRVSAS